MTAADLESLLARSRAKLLDLLEAVAGTPDPAAALAWRPGPGRAPLAWQFMHVAATDDRHLTVRMTGGDLAAPEFVRRFAGGSVPDDDTPPLDVIRRYLAERRAALVAHLRTLTAADLLAKPNEKAAWVYEEWFQVLAWHEAHHHGQAHLTYNLYRAAQAPV